VKVLKREVLGEEDKQAKESIENKWDYQELKNVIYATIDLQYRPASNNIDQNREGWGSWMMRGGGLLYARQQQAQNDDQIPDEFIEPPLNESDKSPLQLKGPASKIKGEANHELTISNESFLTRDATFAQLTFNLHSGVVRLNVESDQKLSKMRLEMGSDVDGASPADNLVRIEFKKLTSQMQFKFRHEALVSIVQLAEFTVYDDHTKKTIYPKLVFTSPVMRPRLNSGPPIQPKKPSPVFYFSYERTEGIMQRIHCETAPLTVIHNAELLRMAKGFVSRKNHIELAEDGLEVWRQRERYRDLRMGAKRNIKSALDKVLSGRAPTAVTGSQLNITLDLAAPKIIIPQNIVNENSPQILIDFGRLKFSNVHEDSGEGEDEEFFTPESTPPNEGVHQEIFETKAGFILGGRTLRYMMTHPYLANTIFLTI